MNAIELNRITKPLDIGFSSGKNNLWTVLNRGTGVGFKRAFDRSYPTHTFFFTKDRAETMATELTEDGIEEDSAFKYLNESTRAGKLIYIYRYKHWIPGNCEKALDRLVSLRQIKQKYSWFEAIGKNRVIRTVFPRLTSKHSERETCDENVFTILKTFGRWNKYPSEWANDSRNIHPHLLRCVLDRDRYNFEKIYIG